MLLFVCDGRIDTPEVSGYDDLEARLQGADQQRSRLRAYVLRAEEEERRRIAAHIHDDTLQVMAAATMQIGELRRSLAGSATAEKLQDLEGIVQAAMTRLRSLLSDLRPPPLDRDGLRETLRRYLAERCEEAGVAYEVADDLHGEPPLETSVVAFRIAQEAITNVAKHARASSVTVALRRHQQGLRVHITDDGRGFAEDERVPRKRAGLRAMEERAALFGGRLWVRSAPGAGTTVEFWIPEPADSIRAGSPAPSPRS